MSSTEETTTSESTGVSDLVPLLLEDRCRRDEELAAERERRAEESRQHATQIQQQMEMIRSLVVSSRTPTVEATATGSRPAHDRDEYHDKLVLTKLTENEDIEEYLTTFERMMTVYGVHEDWWAIKLAPQLIGRALEAYAALSNTAAADYKEVKRAIFRRYDIGEETYRQRFRSTTKKEGESYTELATRLSTLANTWLTGCDSASAVIEKLVVEQFLDVVPSELRIWLCERKPATGVQAAALAENYILARRRKRPDGMKRNMQKRDRLGRDTIRCFGCNQEGHIVAQCPNKPQSKVSETDNKPENKLEQSRKPKCFSCGERGHLARNCPSAFYSTERNHTPGKGAVKERVVEVWSGCQEVGSGDQVLEVKSGGGQVLEVKSGGGQVLEVKSGGGQVLEVNSGGQVLEVQSGGQGRDDGFPTGDWGSYCGAPVTRSGTVNGQHVDNIVLHTGCNRTMVRQDVIPNTCHITGSTVQIRCAHGDITTYPLACIHIVIDGVEADVIAAVSHTLKVAMLVGTDVPQLRCLLNSAPPAVNHHEPQKAFVVTRAQNRKHHEDEHRNDQRDKSSDVHPSPVDERELDIFDAFIR